MLSERPVICLSLTIIALCVGCLWYLDAKRGTSLGKETDQPKNNEASIDSIRDSGRGDSRKEPPAATTGGQAPSPKAEEPTKGQSIAQRTRLQLLDSSSLSLSKGAIALLDLTPAQSKELNQELGGFIERLRAAELKNAYVFVKSDGSEEIVVSPFDRGPLLNDFRASVAAKVGENVADICAKQMPYDSTLAVENAEMRVYIEKGVDHQDTVVFERKVRRREVEDSMGPMPSMKPRAKTANFINKVPVDQGFNIRYRHLFDAENTLPRKTEAAK